MSKVTMRWSAFFLLIAIAAKAQGIGAAKSSVSFWVSEKGLISISAQLAVPNSQAGQSSVLMLLVLPLEVPSTDQITVPNDVYVSRLSSGPHYTTLVFAVSSSLRVIHFEVKEGIPISETLDGKGKVEFDLSYPTMSQLEKDLMNSSIATGTVTYQIVLPKKYDEADVGVSNLTRIDERTFQVDLEWAQKNGISKLWVSFPNPSERSLGYAKLAVSLLIGLIALIFQTKPLRDRHIRTFILLFLMSFLVLGVAIYFYFYLAKRLDFLVFSATALPTAIYAFCASVYLIYVKKKQATVDGQVNINDTPAPFVSVKLFGKQNGSLVSVAETETREGGRYRFYVWINPSIGSYKIVATYGNVTRESDEFFLTKGKPIPGPVLNIEVNVQAKESSSGAVMPTQPRIQETP